MAVRNPDGTFVPGVIYCLVSGDLTTDDFDVFYVGESADPERRKQEHYTAGMNATASSTDVYKHIVDLHHRKIPWTLNVIMEYGAEGPEAAEDEVLCKFMLEGCQLKNMKHGNKFWEDVVLEMRRLCFDNYAEYKEFKARIAAEKNKPTPQQAMMQDLLSSIPKVTKADLKESAAKRKALKVAKAAKELKSK